MDSCKRRITRRRLIKTSAAACAAAPYVLTSTATGAPGAAPASERITLGMIGCGNINTWHMRSFLARKDAQIVAVCDPFAGRRQRYRQQVDAPARGRLCRDYRDFRDLTDDEVRSLL